MNINEICQPENDGTFWWLIMPQLEIPVRNVVVEVNQVLENWWFASPGDRRNYHSGEIQKLLERGGKLIRIEEPK